jgi:hypothetical protein
MEQNSLILWIAAVIVLCHGCEAKQKAVNVETNSTVVAKTYTDTEAGDWR